MKGEGTEHIAKEQKRVGVEVIFGVVGIPIVQLAQAIQEEGILYIIY